VLQILSKIFKVAEPRVFEDLALECVQACITSLKQGAAYIRTLSGVMHVDLLLVKHLVVRHVSWNDLFVFVVVMMVRSSNWMMAWTCPLLHTTAPLVV